MANIPQVNKDIDIYINDSDLYGKHPKAIPKQEKDIGIYNKEVFYDNIVQAGLSSQLDVAKIESFTQLSNNRETTLRLLDTMSEDSTIAAVLEVYAEDATETNDEGDIVWCVSTDSNISKYVTYLLDTMNVNKNIYKWMYNLCKYGDVYLRLYHESEYENELFEPSADKKGVLNEDVILKAFSKNDKLVHYVEMVPNPAEMFELTRMGKTYAYIKANINAMAKKDDLMNFSTYRYVFKRQDVELYDPTVFVHAALEDSTSRVPEEVEIFLTQDDLESNSNGLTYTVKKGQSLLYNSFKVWREMTLLENSLILNRLSKSSIIRVVGVEVGDMPKESVAPHLLGIKNLIEQKCAFDVGKSMAEYTNPGPIENNIYVPTHGGIGAISTQQIGGDVDVKSLADVDYFRNKLSGALRVPKQYLGDTDDAAGFNGGTSLSLISSRYAKAIKRIQNTMIQMITDAVNIMLLDKGLDSYINKFQIKMQPPTTQEEKDRRDLESTHINMIQDIMNLLDGVDIEEPASKLKILKALLSDIVSDNDVISIIQAQIEKLEEEDAEEDSEDVDDDIDINIHDRRRPSSSVSSSSPPNIKNEPKDLKIDNDVTSEVITPDVTLPTPDELGIGDLTDLNNEQVS